VSDEINKARAKRHVLRLPNKKRKPNIVELLKRLHSTDMTPDELESLDDEVLETLGDESTKGG
jgi:L-asparaginase/Glu-tRNA(Gln) amidotransferase subunit D